MRIREVIWKQRFVGKLLAKHGVSIEEAEDVLHARNLIRKVAKGRVKGQDLYAAFAQTREGRYLVVIFIHKGHGVALPISARDMDRSERKYYERQR